MIIQYIEMSNSHSGATVQSFSITLPVPLFQFLEDYKTKNDMKRSQALEVAVRMLQDVALEKEYTAAAEEMKQDQLFWNNTISDGLENETW